MAMTPSRTAWIAAAVMLVATWAAVMAGRHAGTGGPGGRIAAGYEPEDRTGARLVRESVRRETPPPVRIRRDPFRFAAQAPRDSVVASALASAALQALSSLSAVEAGPRIQLLGLAASHVDRAVVRTAVLTVDGDVVLAREGTVVAGRFRVAGITEDAVSLEPADGGPARVLRLR